MAQIKNKGTVPQGMLAPSGYTETPANPNVQQTTRPGGTLLTPSPGYDSVRRGKNRFQGKGFTGGFRPMEYAEDIDGTGAALSVIPGSTGVLEVTEWLPENSDSIPEGAMIIADRTHEPGFAQRLHEAYNKLPDMGDRHPERPITKSTWLQHPFAMFHKDYREHPAVTLIATAGLVWLVNVVAKDVESSIRGYRPRGVGEAVTEPPAAAASTAGDVSQEIANSTSEAVEQIGKVTDESVRKIEGAAESAVSKLENAG